jgi:hypothetical protein
MLTSLERYTTFFILYPIGAASEAFLALSTLPLTSSLSTWSTAEYVRLGLFAIWWPGKYPLSVTVYALLTVISQDSTSCTLI